MPEYLVIGGAGDAAIDALAVAADAARINGAQVDIAVPAEAKAAAELGGNVRRVIGFELAPSSVPEVSLGALKKAAGGGWQNALSAARGKLKEAAESAAENFEQYRNLREELRAARYDAVLDLSASAGSVIVARCADAVKVVGFAAENVPHAPPGLQLLYHENYPAPKNIPRQRRCRMLAGRALGYEPRARPEWNFKEFPLPEWAPEAPFVFVWGNIPAPFAEILTASGARLAGALPAPPPEDVSPEALLASVGAAACVAGSGLAAALAAARGTPVLFIGGAADMPPGAVLTDSPAALKKELDAVLSSASPETPPETAETSGADSDSDSVAPSSGGLRVRKN